MKSTAKADVHILRRPEKLFCDQSSPEEFSTLEWVASGSSASESDVSPPTPVQTDISMNQNRWLAEAAKALVEFAVDAQMQGFGVDRRTAMESIQSTRIDLTFVLARRGRRRIVSWGFDASSPS